MKRRVVLDLSSTRPVWSAPVGVGKTVAAAFGAGFDVVTVSTPSSSDGDGGSGSDETLRAAAGAEVYMGWGVPARVAEVAAGTLKWAHTAAAGAGGSITPAFRSTG